MVKQIQYNNINMVSVWCRTYNHKDYISDALEGLVSQETSFAFEVIVFDDASTDGTSDIVREYEAKYPKIVHAIISDENIYRRSDGVEIAWEIWKKYFTGKYLAFCEGDDFWIDRNKLQIQVDYMESHPECSMYMHNALWWNCQNGTMKAGNPFRGNIEGDVGAEELIMQYNSYPSTASFLFRREQIDKPQFFRNAPAEDYATILFALSTGKVYYSSRIMSVYRVFANGSFAVRMQRMDQVRLRFYMKLLIFYKNYDKYTDYKYHIWIARRIACCDLAIMYGCALNRSITEYVRSCEEPGDPLPVEIWEYIEGLEVRRSQEIPDELRDFVSKYKHIIIMGTGEFGTYAAKQLMNHHVEFDGFAVTAGTAEETQFMEKEIYELSKLPYDKKETGIIIGICPYSGKWSWDSVLKSLKSAEIVNFYCPFL